MSKIGPFFATLALGALVVSHKRNQIDQINDRLKRLQNAPQVLYVLAQTHPHSVILASSHDFTMLENEMAELNETVNHVKLREERHVYAILPVPLPLKIG
jgi:hypothetical protein